MLFKTFQEYKNVARKEGVSLPKKLNYESKFHPGKIVYTQHGEGYISLIFNTIRMFGSEMSDENPMIFIELGTFNGGLTLILHEEFGNSLEISSFDKKNYISPKDKELLFNNQNVTFFEEDLLIRENKRLVTLLKEFSGTRKILYCDNGNKETEINFYAKYLDSGDLLGCHDYFVQLDPLNIKETIKNFEPFNWDQWEDSRLFSRFWRKR